ncbi:hypothetical protein BH10CYA1_BH10CYA1_12370 [soil metagenome]
MSRFGFNPEMSASANFTPSGGESSAASAIDMHRATVFQPGIESHAAAIAPGAEQSIMTAMQAAAQPISPLIQMIMRMPGQIGLLSSMFEALGNFLMGHANLLAGFDPSILAGAHAALTSMPVGEHMGISLSLLPNGAPIFQNLGGLGSNGGDMLGVVGKGAAGQFNTPDILKDSVAFRDQLKVSGSLDLNKPQFEMGKLSNQVDGLSGKGDALSGPAMREASAANHLAGANRLFGDRPVSLTSHSPMASTQSVASAQTVPISGQVPSSLNVNGSNFNSDLSATGSMSDAAPAASASQNVGSFNVSQLGRSAMDSSTGSSVGPSGALGDHLGANKFVAMDKGVATFHPTLGAPDASTATGYDASYLQHQTPTADTSHNLGGLKAKELSLDSVVGKTHVVQPHATPTAHAPAAQHAAPAADHVAHAKSVMDHQGHQTAGSSHSHSSAFSGRDGISHINRAPAHVAQPRIAAQQMSKPAAPAATNASFEQAAIPNQQMVADGSQLQQPIADGSQVAPDGTQVADGTQIAQAGDASQVPAGSDATQAAPAAPSTYTIRAGDCLWNIAKDNLGAPTRWSEIYKMNADVLGSNPSLIHPGTNINLPGGGSEVASTGMEHGEYIVKSGDNLWDISKHTTGDGSKWGEIYNLNKDVIGANPSLILPGQHLQLPGTGAEASGTLAQAPTAAATQQLASAPQAAGAPSAAPTGGDSLRMEGGTPISADGTISQTPVQSYSPGELQAQTPTAAPEAAMEAPQAPAPQADPAQAAAAPVVGGPGAAAAATLPPQQPTPAELHQLTAPKNDIVSSNLTADLAQFIRKTK